MPRAERTLRAVLGAGVAVVVAACGTTVTPAQVAASAPGAADGLTAPTTGPSSTSGPLPGSAAGPGSVGGTGPGGIVTGPGGVPTTGPTAGGPVPAGATGGATTRPISLGILYAVNDGAQSAGIDNGTTITPGNVMHAYV